MSQGLRDMLANRRFAIPLILLMGACFIGLLLIGIVLITGLGRSPESEPVAEATVAATATPTDSVPATSIVPTATATSRPTPTLVPVGTSDSSAGEATATSEGDAPVTVPAEEGTEQATTEPTEEATVEPTAEEESGAEATATTAPEDEELAQTGIGWGLVVASGAGLAALAVAARRLRLAG